MADSIQEQIMEKIVSALAEVTTTNGYANTVQSVQRHNQSGVNLSTVPTVLVKESDCLAELDKSSHQRVRRRLEWFAVAITRQDETSTSTDTRSGAEQLNSLVADIEQRVAASRSWDGLAIMTDPPDYLEVEIDAVTPHLARGLRFSTVYEHTRNDPYSQT